MSSHTSSESKRAESAPVDAAAAASIDIATEVQRLADVSGGREEFLQRVSAFLGESLQAALVAVHDSPWPQPRMLVRDERIAGGIDRDHVHALLDSSVAPVSSSTIACDPVAGGMVMAGADSIVCGSMSTELFPAPHRCSLLVIESGPRNASEMLPAMRTLTAVSSAARATRFHHAGDATDTDSHDRVAPAAMGNLVDLKKADDRSAALMDSSGLDQNVRVRASLRRFHGSLDPTATSYTIASELPHLLLCDRAAVLIARPRRGNRRKYRVTAISGSSVVDRRSPLIRTMSRFADRVSIIGEPIVLPPPGECPVDDPTHEAKNRQVPGDSSKNDAMAVTRTPAEHAGHLSDLPPQIVDVLEEYLDESGVLSVTVLPIFDPATASDSSQVADASVDSSVSGMATNRKDADAPIAIVLLETFSGEPTGITPGMIEIGKEAATAIGNSLRYDDVFALPIRRPLAGLSRAAVRNWMFAMMILVAGLVIASWFIRVDHTVVATGVARPVERRAVFAPVDGVVDEILVRDGQEVAEGDVLVRLENSEIARESQSLAGQLATATEKLASLRAMRLAGEDGPREVAQSVIEQGALESEIRTIGRRIEINEALKEELVIRAAIAGVVVGWRLDEKLRSRPVSRGDRLFALVAPDGQWELDLKLEESNAGEIMKLHHQGDSLPVRFAIASQPTQTYHAAVSQIGGVARRRADSLNVVDVVASVASDADGPLQRDGFRGDIDVTAKIVCPPRRLIDSLSDGLVAWWHRHILFRFR